MAYALVNLFTDGTVVSSDGSVSIGSILHDQYGKLSYEEL